MADLTGEKPTGDDYQHVKALLEEAEQEQDDDVKTLEDWQAEGPEKWGKVTQIVDASEDGSRTAS